MATLASLGQQFLPVHPLQVALDRLAAAESSGEERGAVFTRREVVEFMLDLIGYTSDAPLHTVRILEPSFGGGDFLLVIVERLLQAYNRNSTGGDVVSDLRNCIRAVELHRETHRSTRIKLGVVLQEWGMTTGQAEAVLEEWLIQGDYLLSHLPEPFDFAAGNPPYVRQEMIPDELLTEYRKRFSTIYDRADLYVPFFEKTLLHLGQGGTMGFICADRWTKNRYGGPLRSLIADKYHVRHYVDMVDTDAFHKDVIAYPAITVITREGAGDTRIAYRPPVSAQALARLAAALRTQTVDENGLVTQVPHVAQGSAPWLLGCMDRLALVRKLEARFPTLEEVGCKVGIGVATGADKVYIGQYEALDVEPDRKLPLVMTRDIRSGVIQWRGYGVVNPFNEDGSLVNLADYPRLAAYLERHGEAILTRNVAKKNPNSWYRTIDRIYPSLVTCPKLLVPDIKGEASFVYDEGRFYPHHNFYHIVSDEWDLRALQAVLLSGIARLFVEAYSTKMAGGFLRYQAQYLRRIRIPKWSDVPDQLKAELIQAADGGDIEARNAVVYRLYELTRDEQVVLDGE